VKYNIKYRNQNGKLVHKYRDSKTILLASESDISYKEVLDQMCKELNPEHLSFNTEMYKTPNREFHSVVERPNKSMKPSGFPISDLLYNSATKLGPTQFKNVASSSSLLPPE
jgi:hypothetical protein